MKRHVNKPKKKNEERQHTLGWEEKRMLDLGFEGWREKRRERERNRWVREKKKREEEEVLVSHGWGLLFWFLLIGLPMKY